MSYINPYKKFTGIFIPDWLLDSDSVSMQSKLVYAILCKKAGKDGKCYPKQQTIADALKVSRRSISKYIKELCDAGLIEKKNTLRNNNYLFLEHPDMFQCANSSHSSENAASHSSEKESSHSSENTASHSNKESPNKESPNKESVSEKIQHASSVKALLDIWLSYRKQKNKHATLYEIDMLTHQMKKWGVGKTKKIITISIQNGWMTLKEEYIDNDEPTNNHKMQFV